MDALIFSMSLHLTTDAVFVCNCHNFHVSAIVFDQTSCTRVTYPSVLDENTCIFTAVLWNQVLAMFQQGIWFNTKT